MKILAFDIGTTSLKAALIDENLEILDLVSKNAKIDFPKSGWAEIDLDNLWSDLCELSSKLDKLDSVDALIFAPHMAGVVPVDKEGNALMKAMIWLDERAAGYPKDLFSGILKYAGYNIPKLMKFLRITGGGPSKTGKDPISKILWLRDNEPEIFSKTAKMLDIKSYLIARCCGVFVTSPDEATLTWLADTRGGVAKWSRSLLKNYRLDPNLFPEIKDSASVAGEMKGNACKDLGIKAKVIVGAGDLASAAVGSGAVKDGEAHIYAGTSDWVAAHIGKRIVDIPHYIGCLLSAIQRRYLLIAEQEIAGGAIEWAMKNLGIDSYEEVESILKKGNILFLPWMCGERSPVDNPFLRGAILNLSLENDRGEVMNSVMEGIALNIKWAYLYFEKHAGRQESIRAIGGCMLFDKFCQMLADATKRPILRLREPKYAGLRGAAAIAIVALLRESFENVTKRFKVDKTFRPSDTERYDRLFRLFVESYKGLKNVYKSLNSQDYRKI
ncbi:MAG: FGGY-family carbohydrate kinase [Candidatus Methanoglobus sp.]